MSTLTLESLADRLSKIEAAVERLQTASDPSRLVFKDWRKAVAVAAREPVPDPESQKAFEETLREMREADRRAAEEEADRLEASSGEVR